MCRNVFVSPREGHLITLKLVVLLRQDEVCRCRDSNRSSDVKHFSAVTHVRKYPRDTAIVYIVPECVVAISHVSIVKSRCAIFVDTD